MGAVRVGQGPRVLQGGWLRTCLCPEAPHGPPSLAGSALPKRDALSSHAPCLTLEDDSPAGAQGAGTPRPAGSLRDTELVRSPTSGRAEGPSYQLRRDSRAQLGAGCGPWQLKARRSPGGSEETPAPASWPGRGGQMQGANTGTPETPESQVTEKECVSPRCRGECGATLTLKRRRPLHGGWWPGLHLEVPPGDFPARRAPGTAGPRPTPSPAWAAADSKAGQRALSLHGH